ncbi:MAG: RNA polymerase sigma-70 factor [Bacteroidales bacterium]|jgi:RNA polymerase sigma-70 factor (ECF subfamily)|nr:RNA polymerase sigma-70 factor [Bacteroidales bacterium]
MNDLKTLTDAIRAGSEVAFEAFFRAEFSNVAFFVNRYIHDRCQAEDIAQEAFLALWKHRDNLDTERNLRNYVLTIARNRALNWLRDVIARQGGTLEAHEALIHSRILQDPEVDQRIDALETEQMLARVFNSLPEKVREMFRLNREEGMTYTEIAAKHGVSTKVVEYNIVLALKAFRKALPDPDF